MVIDRRLAILLPPVAVAAVVIANAWSGLMPGVGFWDTGEFQTILPIMGTAHPTGYPTYVLLGFLGNLLLTPIGEPAYRVNSISLVAVAIAAGAIVALVRRLTDSTIIGVASGLGLALTPVVWGNATRADPHPIHLCFVALLMLALVRWADGRGELLEPGSTTDARSVDRQLILAAVLFGLAVGNHSLTLLLIPPIALYVLAVQPGILRRWRFVLACLVAAFGTAALVFLELPIRGGLLPAPLIYGRPATWDGFWYVALAEQFRGSLGNVFADLPDKVIGLVTFTTNQLGPLAVAVPFAFVIAARRAPRYVLLSASALVITVLFNSSYTNADIGRYYLGPALWIWTWFGILAAEGADLATVLLASLAPGPLASSLARPAFRWISMGVAAVVGLALLLPTLGDLDTRRQYADRSGERDAAAWLAEALPAIPQGAVVVSWWWTSTPLWYAQKVEGLRPDIDIIDDRTMLDRDLGRAPDVINRYLGMRPVYVIRANEHDTTELTSQFEMTVVASDGYGRAVWEVHGRLGATP